METQIKRKDTLYSFIRTLNIPVMTTLPKAFYRFNGISIKITMVIFGIIEKITLKFTGNFKRPQIAKILLKKMEAIISRFLNILQRNQGNVVLA